MALIELDKSVFDIKSAMRCYENKELGQTITKIGYRYIGNGKIGMDNSRKQ